MLLATFVKFHDITEAIKSIKAELALEDHQIFTLKLVLEAASVEEEEVKYVLTYNYHGGKERDKIELTQRWATIAIHRHQQTNTLYTINAINAIIRKDHSTLSINEYRTIPIEWDKFQNCMLLTKDKQAKTYHTHIVRNRIGDEERGNHTHE